MQLSTVLALVELHTGYWMIARELLGESFDHECQNLPPLIPQTPHEQRQNLRLDLVGAPRVEEGAPKERFSKPASVPCSPMNPLSHHAVQPLSMSISAHSLIVPCQPTFHASRLQLEHCHDTLRTAVRHLASRCKLPSTNKSN